MLAKPEEIAKEVADAAVAAAAADTRITTDDERAVYAAAFAAVYANARPDSASDIAARPDLVSKVKAAFEKASPQTAQQTAPQAAQGMAYQVAFATVYAHLTTPTPSDITPATSLRTEIIESQKTLADYLKWKLLAVAAIAVVAFGLDGRPQATPYLICVIPFVCFYIDLVCSNRLAQTYVVAKYLRRRGDPYETSVKEIRDEDLKGGFSYERWALFFTSWALAIAVPLYSVVLSLTSHPSWAGAFVVVSGGVGLALGVFVQDRLHTTRQRLKDDDWPSRWSPNQRLRTDLKKRMIYLGIGVALFIVGYVVSAITIDWSNVIKFILEYKVIPIVMYVFGLWFLVYSSFGTRPKD